MIGIRYKNHKLAHLTGGFINGLQYRQIRPGPRNKNKSGRYDGDGGDGGTLVSWR